MTPLISTALGDDDYDFPEPLEKTFFRGPEVFEELNRRLREAQTREHGVQGMKWGVHKSSEGVWSVTHDGKEVAQIHKKDLPYGVSQGRLVDYRVGGGSGHYIKYAPELGIQNPRASIKHKIDAVDTVKRTLSPRFEGNREAREGGGGSGDFSHSGRRGEVGGSSKGGGKKGKPSIHSQRAKTSYVKYTPEKERQTDKDEAAIAKALGGKHMPDHSAWDVKLGKIGVEVKTMFPGRKSDQVFLHADSYTKKLADVKSSGTKPYVVVVDRRQGTPRILVAQMTSRNPHASAMTEVKLGNLKKVLLGLKGQ